MYQSSNVDTVNLWEYRASANLTRTMVIPARQQAKFWCRFVLKVWGGQTKLALLKTVMSILFNYRWLKAQNTRKHCPILMYSQTLDSKVKYNEFNQENVVIGKKSTLFRLDSSFLAKVKSCCLKFQSSLIHLVFVDKEYVTHHFGQSLIRLWVLMVMNMHDYNSQIYTCTVVWPPLYTLCIGEICFTSFL